MGLQRNVLEITNPDLDYRSIDAIVAQAAYRSGMIKKDVLTEKQAITLLMKLIGRREYADYEDYRQNFSVAYHEVFLIGDLRYKVNVYPNEAIYRVTDYTYGYSYAINEPD